MNNKFLYIAIIGMIVVNAVVIYKLQKLQDFADGLQAQIEPTIQQVQNIVGKL